MRAKLRYEWWCQKRLKRGYWNPVARLRIIYLFGVPIHRKKIENFKQFSLINTQTQNAQIIQFIVHLRVLRLPNRIVANKIKINPPPFVARQKIQKFFL